MLVAELLSHFQQNVWLDSCILHTFIREAETFKHCRKANGCVRDHVPPCPMPIHTSSPSSMPRTPTYTTCTNDRSWQDSIGSWSRLVSRARRFLSTGSTYSKNVRLARLGRGLRGGDIVETEPLPSHSLSLAQLLGLLQTLHGREVEIMVGEGWGLN